MSLSKLIFFVLISYAAYKGWENYHTKREQEKRLAAVITSSAELQKIDAAISQQKPYLVVYGRDNCGYTSQMRQRLASAGVQFTYLSVDDKNAASYLHHRMSIKGVDTSYYELPVIDSHDQIAVRPEPATVITQAR